jgi:SSS family solute:Na+ symporter
VVYLALQDAGGWGAVQKTLQTVAANPAALDLKPVGESYAANAWTSAWQPLLGGADSNPMGVDWFAMVFGLGFVLSFGYWCTNFLVVQRAMAAKNMTAARNTPLVAAVPKMLFPALVILPGLLAITLASLPGKNYRLPAPPIDGEKFTAAVQVLTKASAQEADAGYKAVSEAIGQKMSKDQVVALIQNRAVDPFLVAVNAQRAAGDATAEAKNNLKAMRRKGAPATEISAAEAKLQLAKAGLKTAEEQQAAAEKALNARLYDAVQANDYDGVILSLVKKYCPTGLLGLALTALLASFMSGMAGNVTAFNTVWTYDLYQSMRRRFFDRPRPCTITGKDGRAEEVMFTPKEPSDSHYMWMGRFITVVGILLSIGCAYFARMYNNAMDVIQLVFGFVNAPLFATFLLGMFWARCTGTGAFFGLIGGISTSAIFHALTIATGNAPGVKGGYIAVAQEFPSEMAQNFWLASFAFLACFVLTVVISLATKRTKSDGELTGLVYSLTPKIVDTTQAWILRPAVLGTVLLIGCVILNVIFW